MKKISLCIAFFLLIVLCGSAVLSASAATEMDITSHESWEVVSWEDSFKLRWDKVTGASGYWIAIKNNSSGEYYVQNEYTTKTYFTATNYLPEESCTLKIWVGAVTDSSVEPVNSFTSEIIYVYLGHEPDVTIGGSSSITESSAVLEMSVDRDYGFAIEDCGFYVGTSSTKSKMEQYSFWDYSTSYDADTKGTKYMTIPDLEPGTKYYYRAYAVNAAGEYYTSSYKTFTTTKGSLDRPVITYPTDDSTCYTGSDIKLQWNSVSGADSYTYYIKQLSGTPDPTDDDEPYVNMWSASTTKKYYTLDKENLVPGYWYKFVVKASADDAGDGWSEWHYVYIEKGTLEKAEVVSPDNTATYPGGQSIKFEWEAVESAEKYTYYIKQLSGIPDRTNDNEPSIGDPWTETITGTSVTLSGSDVVPGYWYKFVVEATADNMNASWSEWIYCYVDQIQLEKPEILKPTEWTELHESESIVVDWDNVEGADGYVCHIKQLVGEPDSSNNNEPAVFSVKEECSSSRYTLSGDNVHGGYWYKFVIEACSDSAPSTWSNWVYVYVPENGTLERTTISSPSASREYEWGEDILFTWTKVDNATNYTYYVKQLKGEPDSSSNEEAYNLWTGTTNASNRFFTLPGDQVLPDMWYKFVVKAEADGYDTSWSKYTYVYIPDREDWTHAVLKGVVNTVEDEGFANNELLRTFDASESQLATIGKRAFDSCVNLRSIFLPNSVVSIADDAFVNCPQLTIHCYKGSYVQEYAQKKNIPYVLHGVVEKTDMLQLSRTEWNISTAELAEAVITVNSSSKWTASSSASWLTLSETSGTDGANIVFKAAENTSKTSRTAKVTFTCGDASAVVSVSQSGSSGKECTLDLHPDYWEPTSSQRTREIVVTHEDGFTVSSNKSWLDYSVSNATITAEVSSSALNTSQTGILTITCKDCGAVKTVTVAIQQQVVPTPTTVTTSSDEPHAIKVSWKTVSGASYIIERSSDGGSTWKEIATVDAGVTSYTDGDGNVIGASSTHWYRVTATKVLSGSAVRSEPSEAVAGTSIAEVVLSFTGTVGNIGDNGRAALSSLSTLSWTGMTDVTYNLTVKDVTAGSYVNGLKPDSIGSDNSYPISGLLTEGHQYQVWVGAYNGYGRLMGQTRVRTFSVISSTAAKPTITINSVSPAAVINSGNAYFSISFTAANASSVTFDFSGLKVYEKWDKESNGASQGAKTAWTFDGGDIGDAYSYDKTTWTAYFYPEAGTAAGTYTVTVTANGEGGGKEASAAISLTEAPVSNLPDSLYVAQNTSTTCTLASTVMMMRACAYLNGCSTWSSITEAAVKPTAWLTGTGLYNSFTYSFSGNKISVESSSTGGSISAASLKSLLDNHPEGIVLYVYDKPHAVFVTGYAGDVFYCADPVSSYSGKQMTLDSCSIAKTYGWTQAQLLANADKYWYVTSYSVSATTAASLTKEKMLSNLSASSYFGGKKEAVVLLAELMWDNGFSPAFIAGTLANIYAEGSVGLFENIMGYTQTRLLQVYPGLKTVSVSGVAHKNYIAHMKGFTDYDGCGHSHTEYSQYSSKYIYNGFSLSAIDALLADYKAESWHAQFGLGTVQWTADRTVSLMTFYHAEAGAADTITYEQCLAAEMKCINWELLGSKYSVFSGWVNKNNGALDTSDAAYDAGYRVAKYYECPGNTDAYPTRGGYAREIYSIMTGQ